ncbi:MAG TPA: DUF1015 domain-containing protein [Nitrospiraceae bacterium]|jgi:uncharacterized protein (DUF1015 family)|nr:DUF1015 domain-containing protein [Nitrospiraceae bacterium]
MATIIPFRGVLYDPDHVPDLSQVVAPPYDIIDANAQRALHDRHPNNVIRLELGLDQPNDDDARNRYTRAADLLRSWLHAGILLRDNRPAVYFYTIDYRHPLEDPPTRRMRGFLSTVQLEEFGTGRIFPHEDTRSAAKMDRYKLLEACRANFSPIFSLFSDPGSEVLQLLEKSVDTDRPRWTFHDETGLRHGLWTITDPAVLHDLTTAMQAKPLFIADGHHRYETALTYRRRRREEHGSPRPSPVQRPPYDGVLMLISSLEDPGLTVLPTHRVLRVSLPAMTEIRRLLDESFLIEELSFQSTTESSVRRQFLRTMHERGATQQVFGLVRRGTSSYVLLTLKSESQRTLGTSARDRLDVSVLHRLIIDPICRAPLDEQSLLYMKDAQEALDTVKSGTAEAALLLNPTKVSEVQAVAAAGDRMPHKSTYFFPKPLTGLVMNVFDEP